MLKKIRVIIYSSISKLSHTNEFLPIPGAYLEPNLSRHFLGHSTMRGADLIYSMTLLFTFGNSPQSRVRRIKGLGHHVVAFGQKILNKDSRGAGG